jgi:uncharacterized protein (DUF427 family)
VSRHGLHAEPTAKRIRAVLAGGIVLDSTAVRLVWETPKYPQYYVPVADVRAELVPAGDWDEAPGDFGTAQRYDVVMPGGTTAPGGAWAYRDHPELGGLVRFSWDALDTWFEEDEVVSVHPRDPHVRVDALRSSREVRIEIDGTTVAHSVRPTLLFETGLPRRHYLPPTDVRLDLLRPSETGSDCPYKGHARYHSVEVDGVLHRDVVWYYRAPLPESLAIAGMLCFFDERVDVYVDGERQERPDSPFR